MCADVREVRPRTEVVIVRHLRESWKSTGTARAASLAMPSLKCLDYGEDTQPAGAALEGELVSPGTYVLFPSAPVVEWPVPDLKRLIVLDGTWRQTRRMFHRLPTLHALPRLALPSKTETVLRLRETTFADARSTLEAIADALTLIEGPEVGAQLHAVHSLFVERVFRARGIWEQRSSST